MTKKFLSFLLQNLTFLLLLFLSSTDDHGVLSLGSMSSIAVSYGENGPSFCGLDPSGSHLVTCHGSDSAVVFATPPRLRFSGLTAGDGFVCGLLLTTNQPYCWGNSIYIQIGVQQPPMQLQQKAAEYSDISGGDHHLCALRKPTTSSFNNTASSVVDCWGYNITSSYTFSGEIMSLSAGSVFNCGLFSRNRSVVCWGDESGSDVISLIPKGLCFQSVSAGGFHVCGVLEGEGWNSRVVCWGRSLSLDGKKRVVPDLGFNGVVGGKFHACGIKVSDHGVVCWGFRIQNSTNVPVNLRAYAIAAGDYFTCGVLGPKTLSYVCWGSDFPTSLPIATPVVQAAVTTNAGKSNNCGSSVQPWPIFGSLGLVFLVMIICCSALACFVHFKLRKCDCKTRPSSICDVKLKATKRSSFRKEGIKINPDLDELKIRKAQVFSYEELEMATDRFSALSQVGKGSFSRVYKGILRDGTVVAVKKAIVADDKKKSSKEFRTELDLLSRLNHVHLLSLLGYCEEGNERLLVYEFMANGTLHEHLHGKKERLDWIRRVTIAVQAARGIEYLHGYACPPVIHRDIKSSNILIDEEWNARVADFGLSLLGPADSECPLSELPAGTLGYLDPEYYRLHYLTTKSDVYSFGVLLLEILSGRKAIDMQFEDGNIVEWAVPLIKSGNLESFLDQSLQLPAELDALRKIVNVACKCVRMRGRERPSMEKVTTSLERALAVLMGSPSNDHPILPSEVVLGSSRMHKKSSQRSTNPSTSEVDLVDGEDQRLEFRAPSWITFPSVASSQRRKSSVSEGDVLGKNSCRIDVKRVVGGVDGIKNTEEEIKPASPQQQMFLQHNF